MFNKGVYLKRSTSFLLTVLIILLVDFIVEMASIVYDSYGTAGRARYQNILFVCSIYPEAYHPQQPILFYFSY